MTALGYFLGVVAGWIPAGLAIALLAGPALKRNATRYRVIEAGDLYSAARDAERAMP